MNQVNRHSETAFLKLELTKLLEEIDDQIQVIHQEARMLGISPYSMRSTDGKFVLLSLLLPKALVLDGLRHLKEQDDNG